MYRLLLPQVTGMWIITESRDGIGVITPPLLTGNFSRKARKYYITGHPWNTGSFLYSCIPVTGTVQYHIILQSYTNILVVGVEVSISCNDEGAHNKSGKHGTLVFDKGE